MTKLLKCNRCKANKYKPNYMFKMKSNGVYPKHCRRCQYMNRYSHRQGEYMPDFETYHMNMFYECEDCPFIDECRELVKAYRPALCEVEYWEIDEYFDVKYRRIDAEKVSQMLKDNRRAIQPRLPMV